MTARNDAPSSAYLLRNTENAIALNVGFAKKSEARERFLRRRLERIASLRPAPEQAAS
ncbi:MAG: hypothetical protein Q3999_03500 [Buchananella hordeovulneris]|nr:hypothetical protein [Buchananella hordeovulneris]